jgi:hypothetical protein
MGSVQVLALRTAMRMDARMAMAAKLERRMVKETRMETARTESSRAHRMAPAPWEMAVASSEHLHR